MPNLLLSQLPSSLRNLIALLAFFLLAFLVSSASVFGSDPIKLEAEASTGVVLNGMQRCG